MRQEQEGLRRGEARRNQSLEALLTDINLSLSSCSREPEVDDSENIPKVFVFGPMRSGTTLFMQCLAASGLFSYPSNLLSRFYAAPLIGARIQQMLFDTRYRFRDEFDDIQPSTGFQSFNGKTRGILAPNEFWYFWRRFLSAEGSDAVPISESEQEKLQHELNALANVFEKPLALKTMILNEHVAELYKLFPRALFVRLHRDPVFNIQSTLEARRRQSGDLRTWYSFRIREYDALRDLDPLDSVAGQVHAINKSIDLGFKAIPPQQTLDVDYEAFCASPRTFLESLQGRVVDLGASAEQADWSAIPAAFETANTWRLEQYSKEQARRASERMYRQFGAGSRHIQI